MTEAPSGPGTLNGWKEIAAYLGKSVRSVQRWEATLGLPVRRIRTPDGQIVYGLKEEIDEWRRSQSPEGSAEPSLATQARGWLAAQSATLTQAWPRLAWLMIALALLGGYQWGRRAALPSPTIDRVVLSGRFIQAYDPQDRLLWKHDFGHDVTVPDNTLQATVDPVVVDLDMDGSAEVLVAIRPVEQSRLLVQSDALLAFDATGHLLWRVSPSQDLTFGTSEFKAPWRIDAFEHSAGTPKRVWAAFSHHTWWPSQLVEILPSGDVSLRYVQSGRILTLLPWQTLQGPMLAVGGVAVGPLEGTVALLPEVGPAASFNASGESEYDCVQCPTARPSTVWQFPRTELGRVTPRRFPLVGHLVGVGAELVARIEEGASRLHAGHTLVTIGADLALRTWTPADSYWTAHAHVEELGILTHPAAECPERNVTRTVRRWTAAQGWTTLQVAGR